MSLHLRLYVNGESARSRAAREDLEALCRKLPSRVDLEVVDVREQPQRAEEDRVLATPMLIRLLPLPRLMLIGEFGDPGLLDRVFSLESRRAN